MKVREHKKHRVKEMSSRKLSLELLAFTNGVSFLIKNRAATIKVRRTPKKVKNTIIFPINSVKERNSTFFNIHASLF